MKKYIKVILGFGFIFVVLLLGIHFYLISEFNKKTEPVLEFNLLAIDLDEPQIDLKKLENKNFFEIYSRAKFLNKVNKNLSKNEEYITEKEKIINEFNNDVLEYSNNIKIYSQID